MVCSECGKVIEGDDVIQGQHPIAQWGYPVIGGVGQEGSCGMHRRHHQHTR